MKHSFVLLLLLTVAWALWSGHTETLVVCLGAASIVGVTAMAARMRQPGHIDPYLFMLRTLTYVPWLIWEIVKANIDVAKLVVARELDIHPRLIRAHASQKSITAQVVYANSITLTPGTVSLDLRDGQILVHALTRESAEGVLTGEMDRRVAALEGDA